MPLAGLCAVLALYDGGKGRAKSAVFFAIGALGLAGFAILQIVQPRLF